jgi:hypothetical protein
MSKPNSGNTCRQRTAKERLTMSDDSAAAPLHGIVSTPLKVTEGISSTWYYHLRHEDQRVCESLCGAQVFSTEIPLKTWGLVTHLRERYCKECEDIARRSC